MKNPTIAEIRANGGKVRVTHFRFLRNGEYKRRRDIADPTQISPKGGSIVVEITNDAGETVSGRANFNQNTSFVKRFGLNRALGRAIGAAFKSAGALVA